jgi:transposase-like protein
MGAAEEEARRIGSEWHLDEVFIKMNGIHIIYGEPSTNMECSSTFWFSPSGDCGAALCFFLSSFRQRKDHHVSS